MAVSQEDRRQIADAIIKAEAQMEFSLFLHPTNAEEQRQAFLSGEVEEPLFTYRRPKVPVLRVPKFSVESKIDALYRDRIGHTKGLILLLQLVGKDREFSELSEALLPVTGVSNPPPGKEGKEEQPSLGVGEITTAFQEALRVCGLTGWTVEIVEHCSSRMFVNQWEKKIAVRGDILVTKQELRALTRHEIGAHVLRYARGAEQVEPILWVGTHLGRLIEEGVACYVESPDGHPRLYERHLAVSTAASHSFRETWQVLCEDGCSPEDAWVHTLRVKRGLTDGAAHGAFTRDALYVQGFEAIRAFIDGGGGLDPLLSAPIHPEEIGFLTEEAGMEVCPLPPLL